MYSIYGSAFVSLYFKCFLIFLAASVTHWKCFCSRFTGYFEVYRLVRREEELTDRCCGHLRSVNDARLKLSVCNPNERTIVLPADSKPLKCHHLSLSPCRKLVVSLSACVKNIWRLRDFYRHSLINSIFIVTPWLTSINPDPVMNVYLINTGRSPP